MNKKAQNKKALQILGLIGLFLLVFGLSYALFTVTLNGTKKVKVKTGTLSLKITNREGIDETQLDQNEQELVMESQIPKNDYDGVLQDEAYEFNVLNDGTIDARYDLYLKVSNDSTLSANYIKYYLEEDNQSITILPMTLSDAPSEQRTINEEGYTIYKIDNDYLKKLNKHEYTLRIWLAQNAGAESMDKTMTISAYIEGKQITNNPTRFKEGSLAEQIYKDNQIIKTYSEDTPLKSFGYEGNDTDGLYGYPDIDGNTSYFYRGNVNNNYVSFASEIYGYNKWRIIRTLSDGSVRMIAYDDSADYGIKSLYDSETDDWDFTKSNIYKEYEEINHNDREIWQLVKDSEFGDISSYEEEGKVFIKEILSSENSTFCSDSTRSGTIQMGAGNDMQALGVTSTFQDVDPNIDTTNLYGEYQKTKATPTLSCSNNDKISTRIALITGDEYVLAGGGFYTDRKIYLNDGEYNMTTMSPGGYERENSNGVYMNIYIRENDSNWSYIAKTSSNKIRPVITIKRSAMYKTGDGTKNNPYVFD